MADTGEADPMAVVDYDVLVKAWAKVTDGIVSAKKMKEWADKNQIDNDSLKKLVREVTAVALLDMEENDATLSDALNSVYLSGFMTAFEFLRQAVADETFDIIAEGDYVKVKVREVRRED